jgi:hypothetical protein
MATDSSFTLVIVRSDQEIDAMFERASDGELRGSYGVCHDDELDDAYAEGVYATLEWLFDDAAPEPLED